MQQVTAIPLNQLTVWEGNVRRTASKEAQTELQASILAHGLMTSLTVREQEGGKYMVIAGKRRLQAMNDLAATGQLDADYKVPCILTQATATDEEMSLAENVIREPMHPADQFNAFNALVSKGSKIADIAAHFGVSEATVRQRLKLANVAPKVFKAYREGQLNLEQLQAFAITDDKRRQERLLQEEGNRIDNMDGDDIRAALTEGEVPATDRRVRFVTIETYEKAGGRVRRDLFMNDLNGIYLQNEKLLNELVDIKLQAAVNEVKAQGWAWVTLDDEYRAYKYASFKRSTPMKLEMSKETQAQYKALEKELEQLDKKGWDRTKAEDERFEAIEAEIEEIDDKHDLWSEKIRAAAGVYMALDDNGRLLYRRGLVKPDDKKSTPAKSSAGSTDSSSAKASSSDDDSISNALEIELCGYKTAGIAAALTKHRNVALAALAYSMMDRIFEKSTTDCLGINVNLRALRGLPASIANPKTCIGLADLQEQQKVWKAKLPGKSAEVWQWLLDQPLDELLDLLAFCISCTLSARHSNDMHDTEVAKAIGVNMADWFKPTADNYFQRISRGQILAHIKEACKGHVSDDVDSLRKDELAELAEREIPKAAPGWLPPMLRLPVAKPAAAAAAKAAAPKAARKGSNHE